MSIKKSEFTGSNTIDDTATLDFVINGTNIKITKANFLAALGVTGTLVQEGAITGTPILDISGTVNNIRNLEAGSGVMTSVSPENGATIAHNFAQDPIGVAILRNATELQPTFLSLVEGDGIDLTVDGNALTITSSTALAQSKVVNVNSIDDFPDPIAGVITLEADTAYFIANDVSTANRFALSDGGAVVGISPNVATLTYTGVGTMFTGVDAQVDFRTPRIDCPNGQIFDISETGGGNTKLFALDGYIIVSCQTFGTFDNLFSVSISNGAASDCTQGMSFVGTGWGLISIDRSVLGSTDAGFIGVDLGAATSNGIEIDDLFAIGVSGAVGVSGLPSSGNITTGNQATFTNNNFIGAITPEAGGLDVANDIRWLSSGNDGVADTRPDALMSVTGNALTTVIVSPSNDGSNAVKMNAVWSLDGDSHFTADTTGRITYNGERPFTAPIDFTVEAAPVSGSNKTMRAYVAIDGVVQVETGMASTASSGSPNTLASIWQHTFTTGQYVEVFLENGTDGIDLVGQRAVGRVN